MSRRERLRPAHSPERLAELYARPHNHTLWADHLLRVAVTTQVARAIAGGPLAAAADLSCGDGAILQQIFAGERYYGDLAPGWPITGPITDTIDRIPHVDLFVCAETIEHLDDPEAILAAIRPRASHLVLSTPVDAWADANPEHYWAWDRDAVEEMLAAAGWRPRVYTALDVRPAGADYCFGIWGCA